MTKETTSYPSERPGTYSSLIFMARKFLMEPASVDERSDTEFRTGKEDRFLSIVRQEEKTISAICFSYSGSVAQYDDLRQDALINIWRGLDSYETRSSLRTWIYRVVLNSCISTIRRLTRFERENSELSPLLEIVDTDAEEKERVELLHELISTLGAEDRALILMWLDEATYEEMAEVMGMPRNTVATRLRRIREKLAKTYNEKYKG